MSVPGEMACLLLLQRALAVPNLQVTGLWRGLVRHSSLEQLSPRAGVTVQFLCECVRATSLSSKLIHLCIYMGTHL